jgi:hypothetical protein
MNNKTVTGLLLGGIFALFACNTKSQSLTKRK